MMSFSGMVIIGIWILFIPLGIGSLFALHVDKQEKSLSFMWIIGTIVSWAMFQGITVPLILLQKTTMFMVCLFGSISLFLALIGCVTYIYTWKKRGYSFAQERRIKNKIHFDSKEKVGWLFFCILLAFQLFMAVSMNYADGDDAFYVAVSTLAEESNTMYMKLPYTGGTTSLDGRHGLAPFPIWIAFLAKISGIRTVTVAQVVLPLFLIVMAYVLFYKIGLLLFAKKKEVIPFFLIFVALLVIFGDYSYYTVENFMIARTGQGKSVIGSIVIPTVIFISLLMFQSIEESKKIDQVNLISATRVTNKILWVLLFASVMAACLCTTLGTFLISMFLMIIGIVAGIVYKKMSLVIGMALSCAPAVVYAMLYFLVV